MAWDSHSKEFSAARSAAGAAALAVAVIGAVTILGALLFEHGFGLKPCPLCLEQRLAYYVVIPLAGLVVAGAAVGAKRKVLILALVVIAGFMLWNAGLGAYHAGIEWKWWQGPRDCAGGVSSFGNAADLMKQINAATVVRCDEAPWRFLGLSLAGYNVLISAALAAIAVWAAWIGLREVRSDPDDAMA